MLAHGDAADITIVVGVAVGTAACGLAAVGADVGGCATLVLTHGNAADITIVVGVAVDTVTCGLTAVSTDVGGCAPLVLAHGDAADITIVVGVAVDTVACGLTAVGADVGVFRTLMLTHNRAAFVAIMVGVLVLTAVGLLLHRHRHSLPVHYGSIRSGSEDGDLHRTLLQAGHYAAGRNRCHGGIGGSAGHSATCQGADAQIQAGTHTHRVLFLGADLISAHQEQGGRYELSLAHIPAHKEDIVLIDTDIISVGAIHMLAGDHIIAGPQITHGGGIHGGGGRGIAGVDALQAVQLPVAVAAEENDLGIFLKDRLQSCGIVACHTVPALAFQGTRHGIVQALVEQHKDRLVRIRGGECRHLTVEPVHLGLAEGGIHTTGLAAQVNEAVAAHSFAVIDFLRLGGQGTVEFFRISPEVINRIAAIPIVVADGNMYLAGKALGGTGLEDAQRPVVLLFGAVVGHVAVHENTQAGGTIQPDILQQLGKMNAVGMGFRGLHMGIADHLEFRQIAGRQGEGTALGQVGADIAGRANIGPDRIGDQLFRALGNDGMMIHLMGSGKARELEFCQSGVACQGLTVGIRPVEQAIRSGIGGGFGNGNGAVGEAVGMILQLIADAQQVFQFPGHDADGPGKLQIVIAAVGSLEQPEHILSGRQNAAQVGKAFIGGRFLDHHRGAVVILGVVVAEGVGAVGAIGIIRLIDTHPAIDAGCGNGDILPVGIGGLIRSQRIIAAGFLNGDLHRFDRRVAVGTLENMDRIVTGRQDAAKVGQSVVLCGILDGHCLVVVILGIIPAKRLHGAGHLSRAVKAYPAIATGGGDRNILSVGIGGLIGGKGDTVVSARGRMGRQGQNAENQSQGQNQAKVSFEIHENLLLSRG